MECCWLDRERQSTKEGDTNRKGNRWTNDIKAEIVDITQDSNITMVPITSQINNTHTHKNTNENKRNIHCYSDLLTYDVPQRRKQMFFFSWVLFLLVYSMIPLQKFIQYTCWHAAASLYTTDSSPFLSQTKTLWTLNNAHRCSNYLKIYTIEPCTLIFNDFAKVFICFHNCFPVKKTKNPKAIIKPSRKINLIS